jgi:hypothetical protein
MQPLAIDGGSVERGSTWWAGGQAKADPASLKPQLLEFALWDRE